MPETPLHLNPKTWRFVLWAQIPIILITILVYAYVAMSIPSLLQKREELLKTNEELTTKNQLLMQNNEELAAKSISLLQEKIDKSAVVAPSGASGGLKRLFGAWKNIDSETRGLTALEVRIVDAEVWVRAWGKCHPTDCDWGEVKATPYAPSVSSNLAETAQAVAATFKTSFSESILIIHAEPDESLRVETVTRFTDNSGRNSYTATYTFRRRT
jgi:hypothetical protein